MNDLKQFLATTIGKIISVVVVLGAVIFISIHSLPSKQKPVDQPQTADVQSLPSNSLKIGDVGYASLLTPISSTEVVENKIMQLVAQNDAQGLKEFQQMILSGQSSLVDVGTQVKVTGVDSNFYEVKITGGKLSGQSGWMPSQFITARAPATPAQTTAKTKNTITIPPSQKVPAASAPQSSAYCLTLNDCAGFKIKLNFKEDPATCAQNGTCKYHDDDGQNEYVYYVTVRGDTIDGEVRSRNLNSGSEKSYRSLLGSYDAQASKLDFWYGWYTYPNIMEDWNEIDNTGKINGNQFTEADGTQASITYLNITASDKIPKQGCLIKGDTGHVSDYGSIYYLPASASYSKVTSPRDWFCTEAEAIVAGYVKALR